MCSSDPKYTFLPHPPFVCPVFAPEDCQQKQSMRGFGGIEPCCCCCCCCLLLGAHHVTSRVLKHGHSPGAFHHLHWCFSVLLAARVGEATSEAGEGKAPKAAKVGQEERAGFDGFPWREASWMHGCDASEEPITTYIVHCTLFLHVFFLGGGTVCICFCKPVFLNIWVG